MAGDRRRGNLPAETTSLVGRQSMSAQICRLLERNRLVTLTGVGGVGKSRLAVRVAAEMRSRFPDGVWFVPLSPLHDGALLGHTIGEALELSYQSLRPMEEVLSEFLADRRLLLILDTCEHLIDICAATTEVLLEAAPGLTIVTTSRQPLEAAYECVFAVDPLPVRDAEVSAAELDDAVALFIDRAAGILSGAAVNRLDRAAVAQACRRLDGIPLAIELAAARLPDLSLGQLIGRLDDRFRVLADVDHATPPRHQTMRTTVGWSHELCAPLERLMWARLSVFAGDFDAETAEQVCADEHLPAGLVVQLLLGLVDKSILMCVRVPDGTRYRMLDTIRDYGAGWLRRLGEEHDMRRRHRDHYLALARRGDAEWLGPDQFAWYDRMNAEHDDLRAALDFALAEPEGHAAVELAGSLWFFWYGCGFPKEGQHYLEQALAADTKTSPARTQALWACAWVQVVQGDATGCVARAAECAAAADQLGETEAADHALALMMSAAAVRGDLAQQMSLADEVLERRHDEHGLSLPGLVATLNRGLSHIIHGRRLDALAVLHELRATCDRYGERWMRAYGDMLCAHAELAEGRTEAAQACARAALRVKHRMHDRVGTAHAIGVLSAGTAAGHPERAGWLLGLAQQIWDTLGAGQANIPSWVAMRQNAEQQARRAIGDHAYDKAFQTGLDAGLDAGITYALSAPQTPPPHQPADNNSAD